MTGRDVTERDLTEPDVTEQTVVIESCRAGERVALERLSAASGGLSLCSLSRSGASVPAAKYHEGATAALAEARRTVASIPHDVADVATVRTALLGVSERWRSELGTAGRSGPDWAGYLAGGIDALDQVILDQVTEGLATPDVVTVTPRPEVVDDSPAAPPVRRLGRVRAQWPARRIAVVAAGAPALLALLVVASGGRATVIPGGWIALVALIAATSATTLATYLPLPGAGRRLDLGCTPCAAAAALSVVVAGAVLVSTPHDVPTAILAAGVAAFGLRQRLANPSTCPA